MQSRKEPECRYHRGYRAIESSLGTQIFLDGSAVLVEGQRIDLGIQLVGIFPSNLSRILNLYGVTSEGDVYFFYRKGFSFGVMERRLVARPLEHPDMSLDIIRYRVMECFRTSLVFFSHSTCYLVGSGEIYGNGKRLVTHVPDRIIRCMSVSVLSRRRRREGKKERTHMVRLNIELAFRHVVDFEVLSNDFIQVLNNRVILKHPDGSHTVVYSEHSAQDPIACCFQTIPSSIVFSQLYPISRRTLYFSDTSGILWRKWSRSISLVALQDQWIGQANDHLRSMVAILNETSREEDNDSYLIDHRPNPTSSYYFFEVALPDSLVDLTVEVVKRPHTCGGGSFSDLDATIGTLLCEGCSFTGIESFTTNPGRAALKVRYGSAVIMPVSDSNILLILTNSVQWIERLVFEDDGKGITYRHETVSVPDGYRIVTVNKKGIILVNQKDYYQMCWDGQHVPLENAGLHVLAKVVEKQLCL